MSYGHTQFHYRVGHFIVTYALEARRDATQRPVVPSHELQLGAVPRRVRSEQPARPSTQIMLQGSLLQLEQQLVLLALMPTLAC